MTAPMVQCPVCGGSGEVGQCANDGTHGCSHTYDRTWSCHACNESGEVPADEVDLEGELITFEGCGCDMDDPCSDAKCQMDRDLYQRRMYAEYRAHRHSLPPADPWESLYAEQMVDAGRGHLLTDEQRGEYR